MRINWLLKDRAVSASKRVRAGGIRVIESGNGIGEERIPVRQISGALNHIALSAGAGEAKTELAVAQPGRIDETRVGRGIEGLRLVLAGEVRGGLVAFDV